jgi:NAD(P)-dependent dehydrogenase (short-subunit alcohol dehydrogenase family)
MTDATDIFRLDGRNALITGSSRGIGKAIAEMFANLGAKVIISSRKEEACRETADGINARHPGAAIAIPASIGSKADLQHLAERAIASLGTIDILVLNAASNPFYGSLSKISDDQFRKTLENNLLANHWLIQMLAPAMIEQRHGSIILISSTGGTRGSNTVGAYTISKAADFQLARNMAVELGPHGIRVNCIAPGLVRTDFAREIWENPETLAVAVAGTPLGRIAEPTEVAGAAAFLASEAGRFVHGQTIVVDGGATITIGGI